MARTTWSRTEPNRAAIYARVSDKSLLPKSYLTSHISSVRV